jgi:hypothetical protein
MSVITRSETSAGDVRRAPLATFPGGSVSVEWARGRVLSLAGLDEETLGMLANEDLHDRIVRAREQGLNDAVDINDVIRDAEDR